jgi:hypothetical protein
MMACRRAVRSRDADTGREADWLALERADGVRAGQRVSVCTHALCVGQHESATATVGSLSVSAHCAAAWGESVTNGAGDTTYRVRVQSSGAANELESGTTIDVATV